MRGSNDNDDNRIVADFSVDFRNINFMPYRFRTSDKVRPKKDVGKRSKDISDCRRKKNITSTTQQYQIDSYFKIG